VCHCVTQQLVAAHPLFSGGGERVTLDCSVAMIGITSASISLSKFQGDGPHVPTNDHILFTCLYISNAATFRKDGVLAIEYETSNVIRTLDQFKDMTGRSFEPLLDETLLASVQEAREQARTNTQFTPN
jgi:hypothetical protein